VAHHDHLRVAVTTGALSRSIGSNSQRPFAIVIVRGRLATLFISIDLLRAMNVGVARDTDMLPLGAPEIEESV